MKKSAVFSLIVIAAALVLGACAKKEPVPSASASGGDEFDRKYTWSLATTYATGSPMVNAYYYFSEKMKEYSNGAITLNVFPDSVLMGEDDAFLAVKAGELEFAGFGPSTFYLYSEDYGFMLAPFLIPSYEVYLRLYNSPLIEQAKKIWREQYNTRDVGGMGYRGFRSMSSSKSIARVEDLRGLKLRLNTNPLWVDSWKTLGATTVPIALGELYTSLQNGTVDASEGPWEQMKNLNLEEVQNYIALTKHIIEIAGMWMSESTYQALPDHYKAVVDRAGKEAIDYMTKEAMEKEEEFRQALVNGGCEYLEPDLSGFYRIAESVWDQYFKSTWTAATLDEVMRIQQGQ
jgi:tripartite ATP-independent transporter DctP family solute receptor